MRRLVLLFLILIGGSVCLWGQTIDELKKRLSEASGSKQKMILNYNLSDKYFRATNIKKSERYDLAEDYGKRANDLARQRNDNGMTAQSAFLLARIYDAWADADRKRRDSYKRKEKTWLTTALSFAKKAKDSDLIVKSVQRLAKAEKDDRDYRGAAKIYEDAFTFFSQNGRSISKLETDYSMKEMELESDYQQLLADIDRLETDKKRLATDNVQLVESNQKKEEELSKKNRVINEKDKEIVAKEETISTIEEEKEKVEIERERAKRESQKKDRRVRELTKDAIADSLALIEKAFEVEQANRLASEERERNVYYIAGGAFFLLLTLLMYSRYLSKKRSNRKLQEEQERSENLLLNILPKNIAEELKQKGRTTASKHDKVTVLFSDFQNFTAIAEKLSPEQLVLELDKCFKKFDFIIQKYDDIEKIKTIGDAYMCASGLHGKSQYPFTIVRAAIEMQEVLEELKQENIRLGKPYFEARIGLHTGPVVSGVVGTTKFAYDIWGDTVNIASRMESNGAIGKVNISEDTYRLIKYKFDCKHRGKVQAKNKGLIDMYFVERELSGAGVPA
ncbi:MAG: adenylate/guanylate cyclase domain-containing protein [Bacteroidota bacterium]